MATLAESFLADLDELDEEPMEPPAPGGEGADKGDAEAMDCGPDGTTVDTVAPLVNSERFQSVVQAR